MRFLPGRILGNQQRSPCVGRRSGNQVAFKKARTQSVADSNAGRSAGSAMMSLFDRQTSN